MDSFRQALSRLEPFEWLGLAATGAALWIFFAFAHRLDEASGIPGYHWRVVGIIAGIYGRFIPVALLFGLLVFAGAVRWMRDRRRAGWHRFGFAVRVFLSYCALLLVFRVVNFYVPVIHSGLRDPAIQRMDATLFGRQVADWLEPLVRPWLTHLLTGAYISWFWLLFFTILLLVWRSREAASEYLLASLLAFYSGYACYLLVPVIGPGYTLHFSIPVGDIAPVFTLDRFAIPRDCFPSLHTALTVVMFMYVWRHCRIWCLLYAPLGVSIVFATLYLRFHYGMDDVAGAALGVAVSYIAPALQTLWVHRVHNGARPASVPVSWMQVNEARWRHG
jgi:membrane-associated phospholipid phosphatase